MMELLKNFNDKNQNIIGFEPSKNVAEKAKENNIPTINKFFNKKNIKELPNNFKNTDLICASNVICHIPDLNDLIESIDLLYQLMGPLYLKSLI